LRQEISRRSGEDGEGEETMSTETLAEARREEALDSFVTKSTGLPPRKLSTGSQRDSRKGKGRFDLLPALALKRLAQLYERGAEKYGDRNWEKGQPLSWYLDSAARHLFDYLGGDRSEDHVTAVAWNALGFVATEIRINAGLLPAELDDINGAGAPKEESK
jgi:hypothetical protein